MVQNVDEYEYHQGLKTEWVHPVRLTPQPIAGDKIEFDRGLYNHVGIADGRGGIYHFSGEPGKFRADWRHDRIKDVTKGSLMRFNNFLDHTRTPFDEDVIIRRCRSSLGFFKNTYSAHSSNNCEHKANEMRYGSATSQQSETASIVSGGILVIFSIEVT
ncbi:phospholipase A and acyltransferase 4-like [Amphiura filiformis]|uniref:phospholipase A and acyltransferase 4-like n=1 Tax=Amphiura filiformis TaxID=82378 RepID=UPI003B226CDF